MVTLYLAQQTKLLPNPIFAKPSQMFVNKTAWYDIKFIISFFLSFTCFASSNYLAIKLGLSLKGSILLIPSWRIICDVIIRL